eukprot:1191-Heterococcus_DN1.PRE.2
MTSLQRRYVHLLGGTLATRTAAEPVPMSSCNSEATASVIATATQASSAGYLNNVPQCSVPQCVRAALQLYSHVEQ